MNDIRGIQVKNETHLQFHLKSIGFNICSLDKSSVYNYCRRVYLYSVSPVSHKSWSDCNFFVYIHPLNLFHACVGCDSVRKIMERSTGKFVFYYLIRFQENVSSATKTDNIKFVHRFIQYYGQREWNRRLFHFQRQQRCRSVYWSPYYDQCFAFYLYL